ncbi:adenylate kinase [Pseudomonas amygdali]|uniref:Adenylate kinase n=2 Tax=Pseudomonas amygdali pv. lachrymans TaxID=53707 RepID=A0ABR5KSH8_PSEAV|nr:adenylate kinase [Pseudomonas amygdali]AXH60172.1 adenylate kinase [Pseudomonas amygdali pv. lachrymans str. M301315]KPC17573.1 Adenylate kinase [Pseudomonas amygdali pv. lachrymans]RMT05747.1 adenylate kinase [Pseudomonas amygdali pv. lachrymans]
MKILIIGAPGAGKGTQGSLLCERLQIPKLSTGDMLRAEVANKTDIGLQVEALMPTGQLIGDDVVIGLLLARIEQGDCSKGFMLDGFPRTVAQAQALIDAGVQIDQIIALDVDEDVIVERMSGRRFHLPSGRTYHVLHNPPKTEGVDDLTGEPLIQRPDDAEDTVRKRLDVYRAETLPVLHFYQALPHQVRPRIDQVDAMGSVDFVRAAVDALIIEA